LIIKSKNIFPVVFHKLAPKKKALTYIPGLLLY